MFAGAAGFGVSLLGYVAWGGFVAVHYSRVRARVNTGPDDAALSWAAFDLLLTPCVIAPFLVVGVVLTCWRARRPFGIGMALGAVLPLLVGIAYLRFWNGSVR